LQQRTRIVVAEEKILHAAVPQIVANIPTIALKIARRQVKRKTVALEKLLPLFFDCQVVGAAIHKDQSCGLKGNPAGLSIHVDPRNTTIG